MLDCPVCKNDLQESLRLYPKEMMTGKRIQFEYIYCSTCNCLFINDIPAGLDNYYKDYYTARKKLSTTSKLVSIFWRVRSSVALAGLNPLFEFFRKNSILKWLSYLNTDFSDPILDVGCGNGDVLYEFWKHGFKNLTGVDPFYPNKSTEIFKWQFVNGDIFSIRNKKYKLIMFNHSLEHTFEHYKILTRASELLSENGRIMVRMPLINKAFEDYKENWVQLDAPRHLLIHSRKSFEILCPDLGLKIYKVFFDSTEVQFMGSIQYKKNISHYDPNSYKISITDSIFTNKDVIYYSALAKHYNKLGLGDQAAFFLKPI